MLKRAFITIFLLCIVVQLLWSEVLFRMLEDTPAWERSPRTQSNVARIIPKGAVISGVSSLRTDFYVDENRFMGHTAAYFEGTRYQIIANTFAPIDTEELFHQSFLTSIDPQAKIWASSYFLEVLRYGNRDLLVPHEQRWVAEFDGEGYLPWYRHVHRGELGSLAISQGVLMIGGLVQESFSIQRIERIPNGYRVAVSWNDAVYRPWARSIHLPVRTETPVFDFYLIVDGDYMDVFYSTDPSGSDKTFVASYARFDFEMQGQLEGIINPTGFTRIEFDPSRITFWPRRADGSMDFPHHPLTVPENAAAPFIFEDTVVRVDFSTPDAVAQDQPPMPTATEAPQAATSWVVESTPATSVMPLWAGLVIGGGAIAVVGGVVVARRKR